VIKQELPGEPARDLMLIEVTYPPGTGSPPHLHANGVMAFVVSGTIASKVGDAPEQTFGAGSAWWEPPGAVHRVSRNASSTEPAKLLAIYIAPKGATAADLMKPMRAKSLTADCAWAPTRIMMETRDEDILGGSNGGHRPAAHSPAA
jgi:quercetin dioxygenase-like cupin family protein